MGDLIGCDWIEGGEGSLEAPGPGLEAVVGEGCHESQSFHPAHVSGARVFEPLATTAGCIQRPDRGAQQGFSGVGREAGSSGKGAQHSPPG